ncbi:PPE family protein, SVP subgroup [Mycobacterium ostraviense]|uniref:PPE family C-terminal domain-containing protein n=1 Tax=Mycobacterium ostraviense TaxID=2738409 RepID=A0A163W6E1_9MYCO|nr:hypothetical protein [Mycobacterium ostraviense]KZS58040.1 hypothetical protein A4G28_05435 [Mycobacterium ostraviense]UGT92777.1 hypothetical protein LTS72_05275 [Mycobacterium ostraviense]
MAAAAQAELTATHARPAASAYEAAIATTEAHYGEKWAQDAATRYAYAASSDVATRLTPFAAPPWTTNTAALASYAASLSQAAETRKIVHAAVVTLQTLNISSTVVSVLSLLCFVPGALRDLTMPAGMTVGMVPTQGAADTVKVGGTVSAGLGKAARVGGLSVPCMPASATAATIPAPQALAGTSVDALPAVNSVVQQPGAGSGLGSLVGGIPGSSKSPQQAGSAVVRDLLRLNVLPQPQYVV